MMSEEYEELIKRNMFLSLKNVELENKINNAIEYIKEDIDYWQDAIYVELKAEDFIKILNNYLEILEGKENENTSNN